MAAPQKRGISEEAERDSKRARLALSIVCGNAGSDTLARAEGALEREAATRDAAREARIEADEAATEAEFSLRLERRTTSRLLSAMRDAAAGCELTGDALRRFNSALEDIGVSRLEGEEATLDVETKLDLEWATLLAGRGLEDMKAAADERRPPIWVYDFEKEWTKLQEIRQRAGIAPIKPLKELIAEWRVKEAARGGSSTS